VVVVVVVVVKVHHCQDTVSLRCCVGTNYDGTYNDTYYRKNTTMEHFIDHNYFS
jgi:hypothetical protein